MDNHPEEIVNIVTGSLSSNSVNVDDAVQLGITQQILFETNLPQGFYEPLSKSVVTMTALKKSVKVGNDEP